MKFSHIVLAAMALLPVQALAQVKISDMPAVATVTASDSLPVVQSGTNKKVTTNQLGTFISGQNGQADFWPVDPTGDRQTFFGYFAGYGAQNQPAQMATCVGQRTCGGLGTGMSGVENTAFGKFAGGNLTTSGYNTALGVYALQAQSTGNGNTAVGMDSMRDTDGGQYNVAVGGHSLRNISGSNNTILIGWSADVNYAAQSNWINIGNALMGTRLTPVVASGYGTGPTVVGTSFAFKVTVGTGGGAINPAIQFDTAPNGWICDAQNITAGTRAVQTTVAVNAATMTWATAPAAGAVILYRCNAF